MLPFTKEELQIEIDAGYVFFQKHDIHDLYIYNYSQHAQYDNHWNEVTLNCRGLILDGDFNVVARSFKKFFNYEEIDQDNKIPWLTSDYVYIQEKIDGSMGILFNYKNEWILSTRGSFTSDQAIRGMKILKDKYKLQSFETSIAYIVEIIYPENRIVVDYGKEENIVFLGATTPEGELHWTTAELIFKYSGIKEEDIVKTEQIFDLDQELYTKLKSKNETNKEGFVLRFFPSELRVKIKFEDYIRLHKIISGISTKSVWEMLSNDQSFDEILEQIPDEFHNWLNKTIKSMRYQYGQVWSNAGWYYDYITTERNEEYSNSFQTKKDIALYIQSVVPIELRSIVFSMIDGKEYKHLIWKLLKPEFEKPFNF